MSIINYIKKINMKTLKVLFLVAFLGNSISTFACSPCQPLSNVSQTINGTNLELYFTSNAGWQCCYNVEIELICADQNFTGNGNYLSPEICINGGNSGGSTWASPVPYPVTIIDISGFCPGEYKWRGVEPLCFADLYTPVFTFTIEGASPLLVTSSANELIICKNENTQLTATAQNGCNGPYNFSWSPTTGLSNPNSQNPVATPSATTTYTVTVTEPGSCGSTQTSNVTIQVNPLPTANIVDNVGVCLNDPSPTVTITGASGTPPYTINYMMDGVPQPAIVTTGNTFTFTSPTNSVGTVAYTLIDVTDASITQCSQLDNSSISVTVWPLPVVNAGNDVQVCEPNPTSPSNVTLSGSGASSYTWDNGITNGVSFIPPTGVTTYTVTGTDANGCEDTDEVVVTAYPMPVANGLASPLFGNAPLTVDFVNLSQNASNFAWNFGDGNPASNSSAATFDYSFLNPGIYPVTLTASNGICFATWTVDIEVIPPMVVNPPNIFTPNGDGANELYYVNVEHGENITAEIFNRWGLLIATINGLNAGWDGKSNGKIMEDGVYFIKYIAKDYNGLEIDGHTYFHLVR
jgi:gliding motility-associated-like protein